MRGAKVAGKKRSTEERLPSRSFSHRFISSFATPFSPPRPQHHQQERQAEWLLRDFDAAGAVPVSVLLNYLRAELAVRVWFFSRFRLLFSDGDDDDKDRRRRPPPFFAHLLSLPSPSPPLPSFPPSKPNRTPPRPRTNTPCAPPLGIAAAAKQPQGTSPSLAGGSPPLARGWGPRLLDPLLRRRRCCSRNTLTYSTRSSTRSSNRSSSRYRLPRPPWQLRRRPRQRSPRRHLAAPAAFPSSSSRGSASTSATRL